MGRLLACLSFSLFSLNSFNSFAAQSPGNAGSLGGTVTDPSGAAVPQAAVSIINRLSNYRQSVVTDNTGAFRFTNIPPNPYHMEVNAPDFAPYDQDVTVRGAIPINLKVQLALAGEKTTVTVEAASADLLENVPYAHNDVDTKTLDKLPVSTPGSGLSDAVTLSSGAVAADSNGFFHPLGDHAQTSFSIDGQPISDQQSKSFSTQVPINAIQSMELITGTPAAEFGDKTSLIVNAVTKSGLGQKPSGRFMAQWNSFATYSEDATLALGGPKAGNFLAVNALRSGRFLDTPEFMPIHAVGNNGTIFDRFDYQPSGTDTIHLNLFAARNWFQIPNTYDQPGQDQKQKSTTFNLAPGYQHTFGAKMILTVNPFYRTDHVNYYPSRDPFADLPATIAQDRTLTNWGIKADISYASGRHNLKIGTQLMQTRLDENFSFGITDPAYNAVCLDNTGDPQRLPTIADPGMCAGAGFVPNPALLPGLPPYDLTRGGKLFRFTGSTNVNEYAFYVQDSLSFGNLTIHPGLRVDSYHGIITDSSAQPRIGFSYLIKPTGTVMRAGYSRTFETPYNENLVLSSATGVGGLASNVFGAVSEPLRPGTRNQYNAGLEQAFGRFVVASADYFWKYTKNAYDFGTVLDTPIAFPISWRKSKLDGVAVRIGTPNLHGFMWYTTMGHTRARYFGPETGGLIFNNDVRGDAVFRIDHDQAFQQTTNLRYQHGNTGPWVSFTWRYDSGMVAGSVGSLEDALGLTGAQQSAIGFFCGGARPTLDAPLTGAECNSTNYGATRLVIPKEGAENDDHNPPRVAPRHLLDIGAGTDNLFHAEHVRAVLRFAVTNLTNKVALYNFLSTFSGTHFVTPRSYQIALGLVF
ncbi:MAG TPA: TonB-dependent receptor [Bryobacteraceae bacterium]|nr:TonB-dependent receptor [Bryobacteraceae bacterium]